MNYEPYEQLKNYPDTIEIKNWIDSIWDLAEKAEGIAEILEDNGFSHSLGINHHSAEFRYVKFTPKEMDEFYGYWQPTLSPQAPLLIHVPGYGAEMSAHPDLVSQGYNVLHISPLGYATPNGPVESKKRNGNWPVLPDTVTSNAEKGYKIWLANCVLAVKWALNRPEVLPERVSFFGTSQGGGAAILLGSLFKGRGVRCVAADLPFLTHYPMADGRGAYHKALEGLKAVDDKSAGWKSLGLVDTMAHASRLTVPVLLTAGGVDTTCPPETIEALFAKLPGTRSLTFLKDTGHRSTREFIQLAAAWFRIYA